MNIKINYITHPIFDRLDPSKPPSYYIEWTEDNGPLQHGSISCPEIPGSVMAVAAALSLRIATAAGEVK